jgi:release factor glutamine methyltransferase
MVPTPETELLVETTLRIARQFPDQSTRVLDIGTGSGVIAITLSLECPQLKVYATDLSGSALKTAKQNAGRLAPEYPLAFLQSNLFEGLSMMEPFQIIVSNPPYIAEPDRGTLPPEVLADPPCALFAGEEGLDIIRQLISKAPDHLARPGYLLFEIGYNQSRPVFDLVQSDGRYVACTLLKDLNDIDRVVVCKVE